MSNTKFAATTKAARLLVTSSDAFSESRPSCYEVDRTVESVLFNAGAQRQPSQHHHGEALSGPVLNPHVTRTYGFPDSQERATVELIGIAEEVGDHVIRVAFQSWQGFDGTVELECEMMHPLTNDGLRWK